MSKYEVSGLSLTVKPEEIQGDKIVIFIPPNTQKDPDGVFGGPSIANAIKQYNQEGIVLLVYRSSNNDLTEIAGSIAESELEPVYTDPTTNEIIGHHLICKFYPKITIKEAGTILYSNIWVIDDPDTLVRIYDALFNKSGESGGFSEFDFTGEKLKKELTRCKHEISNKLQSVPWNLQPGPIKSAFREIRPENKLMAIVE